MSGSAGEGKAPAGWKLWLPVALWMLLIFSLSSLPIGHERPHLFRFQDKLAHLVEFGVLGLLTARALRLSGARSRRVYWLGILLGVFYGALDELHQYFIPNRTVELADLAADGLGVFLAAWLYLASRGRSLFRQGSEPEKEELSVR
ncbi:MAG: VanZ family protein [Candidatus Glassbacteria bacterium]|nr:VanZ family protein [Candidatus Glassbacteria bacterium]